MCETIFQKNATKCVTRQGKERNKENLGLLEFFSLNRKWGERTIQSTEDSRKENEERLQSAKLFSQGRKICRHIQSWKRWSRKKECSLSPRERETEGVPVENVCPGRDGEKGDRPGVK